MSSFRIGGKGECVEERDVSRRCATGGNETDAEGGKVE